MTDDINLEPVAPLTGALWQRVLYIVGGLLLVPTIITLLVLLIWWLI